MNKLVGLGTSNGPDNLSAALDLGCGLFLVLDVEGAADQCRQIRARHPDAVIIIRRVGQIGVDPAQLAREVAPVWAAYHDQFGIVDFIGWNEIDIEQPWPGRRECAQGVATFAVAFGQAINTLCPWIRLHFPAFSAEEFYQDELQIIWLSAVQAGGYDVVDLHCYGNVNTHVDRQVRAYLDWFRARKIEGRLPAGTLSCITELNFGLGQPRPADYGGDLFRAFGEMVKEPDCQGGQVFIWRWFRPQPGGEALEIWRDSEAQNGIRRAANELPSNPVATMPENMPPVPAEPSNLSPSWVSRNLTPDQRREHYAPMTARIAGARGLDLDIFTKQITQESQWNPLAVSRTGAEGLGQLVPKFYPNVDRFDPEANLRAAATTMRHNLDVFDGDYPSALAAYNAGKSGMGRWIDAYGTGWRRALTEHPDQWLPIVGYAGPAKAGEVSTYLRKILGPEEAQPMGINDLRGKLPRLTGNWPIMDYHPRSLAGISGITIHYTAAPAGQSVRNIAAYQVSAAAATQFGGQPAPGIAYTIVVTEDGTPNLCHDLDRRVWHSAAVVNGIARNVSSVGICYTGDVRPNPDQILGIAQAIVWCETELGRELTLEGHKDPPYSTRCPGDAWPAGWRDELTEAVNRERNPAGPEPAPPAELPADIVNDILSGLDFPFARAGDAVNAGFPDVGFGVQGHIIAIKGLLGVS